MACDTLITRVRSAGHDTATLVPALQRALRPGIEARVALLKEQQRPKGLLSRLFGR